MALPRVAVDGPVPSAPRYNLLNLPGVITTTTDDYWLNGVNMRPYPCGVPHLFNACEGSSSGTLDEGERTENLESAAYEVYLADICSTMGTPADELRSRATVALQAREHYAVENEFMNGTLISANPALADGDGTFPAGDTGHTPGRALSILVEEIAKSGSDGVIHMTPYTATILSADGYLKQGQNRLETLLGTPVVPGQGYTYQKGPGSHPDPAEGEQEWMYASGPIQIRRSEVFVTPSARVEAVDRSINEEVWRASRYYQAAFDKCLQAAVLVNRPAT